VLGIPLLPMNTVKAPLSGGPSRKALSALYSRPRKSSVFCMCQIFNRCFVYRSEATCHAIIPVNIAFCGELRHMMLTSVSAHFDPNLREEGETKGAAG